MNRYGYSTVYGVCPFKKSRYGYQKKTFSKWYNMRAKLFNSQQKHPNKSLESQKLSLATTKLKCTNNIISIHEKSTIFTCKLQRNNMEKWSTKKVLGTYPIWVRPCLTSTHASDSDLGTKNKDDCFKIKEDITF